jgi:hypothetical protein
MRIAKPLTAAATAVPPLAIRLDPGVLMTSVMRYFWPILSSLPVLSSLTRPFSDVLEKARVRKGGFLHNYLDLLCFLLSGLDSHGTITAEVAFMLEEVRLRVIAISCAWWLSLTLSCACLLACSGPTKGLPWSSPGVDLRLLPMLLQHASREAVARCT